MNDVLDIEELVNNFRSQSLLQESNEYITNKRDALLGWYKIKRRLLPWRGDNTSVERSAYGTWVSEVMLQQTRVDTVINYWTKWMERFPNVNALAAATPDEVNQLWAGLGYYRRAQQLRQGAQKVVDNYGGVVPSEVSDLLKVPGIGPYTAGAIASIAHNRCEPLVDGNVIRVLSRLYAIDLEVGAAGGAMEKRCWSLARTLVDPHSPGDFNQALMELGATVCKPTSPLCEACPVSSVCAARQLVQYAKDNPAETDLPAEVVYFPRKVPKKKAKEVTVSVCVLVREPQSDQSPAARRYLFNRRPSKGLLANQWEFPSAVVTPSSAASIREEESSLFLEAVDVTEGAVSGQEQVSREAMWRICPEYLQAALSVQFVPLGEEQSSTNVADPKMVLFEAQPLHVGALMRSTVVAVEPIVHVFSHQRHTMHVSVRHIGYIEERAGAYGGSGGVDRAGPEMRWMTAAEIVEEGITTGCKKVLQAVEVALEAQRTAMSEGVPGPAKSKSDKDISSSSVSRAKSTNAFDVMRQAVASNSKLTSKVKDAPGGSGRMVKRRKI